MAARVKLIQGRVRLEKEEPEKKPTRVRLNTEAPASSSTRVRLNAANPGRVRLEKPAVAKTRFHMAADKPHLHTRIVVEQPRPGETIYWAKMPQDDGRVLYDRIVARNDNASARYSLASTSPYGLMKKYKEFRMIGDEWIPEHLKAIKRKGWG